MRIIEPSIEVWFHRPQQVNEEGEFIGEPLHSEAFLERAGRLCYKSEGKISESSAAKFVAKLRENGHHAMLEHGAASVKYICDRGMSHELVRHRISSYAQESTRYCNYTKEKFDSQIAAILPPFIHPAESNQIWEDTVKVIEDAYARLIAIGEPAQLARSVLPISLKTEIWAMFNLREWMHVFEMRCAGKAHPQIRALMLRTLDIFRRVVPTLYEPLWEKYGVEE